MVMAEFEQNPFEEEEEQGGEQGGEGSGGIQTGEIRFHYKDAMAIAPRDDQLSPKEIERLLIVHKDFHKINVDKQKQTRRERDAVKDGQFRFRQGLGQAAGISRFKKHPISYKAQFSGIDKQVIG